MYEFGEELIIESYKVPWLIWIQLVVMILLVLLLFFGFTILDLPNNSSTSSSSSSTAANPPFTSQNGNQDQNIKRESECEIRRVDESWEREGSTEKDATSLKLFVGSQHPCNYLGLAKQAFLKCLGFDSDADNCRHVKED